MFQKPPPTKMVPPLTPIALTQPSVIGCQAVAAPVFASRAAIELRRWPPILVKNPPAYTTLPETVRAFTGSVD